MSFDHKAMADVPPQVTGPEAMLETIKMLGMVPFFANGHPGFSIEEMTPRGNWFDTQEDLSFTPWDWKIPCVQTGDIAYGKFLLGGKAAFATTKWYAELRNWRHSQPKYQPDADQNRILDYLSHYGSIGIKEVRQLLGVKKGVADAVMTRLQMQCRVVTGDITRVFRGPDLRYNGWQVSSFCTPEDLFGMEMLQVSHSPEASWNCLCDHIRLLVPGVTEKQLFRLLA